MYNHASLFTYQIFGSRHSFGQTWMIITCNKTYIDRQSKHSEMCQLPQFVSICLFCDTINNPEKCIQGARCSSVRQCSTTGVTKAMVCVYPVCGIVHIKEPLLLIGKSSPCGGRGFPLSLS